MKKINFLILSLIVFFTACESLEDTYSDYSGDSMKRYVGKAKNLQAEKGWKRVKLTWENSLDATVDKIKVVWSADDLRDSAILENDATEYTTPQTLQNKTYEFAVYAIDAKEKSSLKTCVYAKPFTKEHELITSLGKVESKYFFNGTNLALFFPKSIERVLDSKLIYYSSGEKQEMQLTQEILQQKHIMIENVDVDKDVQIVSSMQTEECFDIINFDPYSLDRKNISLTGDFINHLKTYYNIEQITTEWIENQETLYVDYDIQSLEDVLHFPKLKHIVLGAHRYFDEEEIEDNLSELIDMDKTVFAFNKLKEINPDLEVDIYNNNFVLYEEDPHSWYPIVHYLSDEIAFEANTFENPTIPSFIRFENMNKWIVSCNTDIIDDFNSRSENILNEDPEIAWKPKETEGLVREHEILIDMQNVEQISGFMFKQPKGYSYYNDYFTQTIQILVSEDNRTYHKTFINQIREVGTGEGETTIINLPEKMNARYIKVIISDIIGTNKYTYIGAFIPF